MAEGTHRRLAAIVSADAVGYSRLMGVDEAGTLQRLNTHRSEHIDPLIAKQGGRIVKTTGDGLLLEFSSVVAAVECCIAFQEGMLERNADVGDDAIQFRVGVHLGDVIVEGDDIFGDGVNTAARLQEIAEPGGICISGSVFQQVLGTSSFNFEDLGFRNLKNIAQPVHTYQLRTEIAATNETSPAGFSFYTGLGKRQPHAAGGCLCGRTIFETWDEPLGVGYCHCRFCQLATGAPLNGYVTYEEKYVTFKGEPPRVYKSSQIAERAFCGNCGTTLYTYFKTTESAGFVAIRLATLDNPEGFAPRSHFAIESQMPWLEINDDLPRICTGDDPGLAARWQSVGQPHNGPVLGTALERQRGNSSD